MPNVCNKWSDFFWDIYLWNLDSPPRHPRPALLKDYESWKFYPKHLKNLEWAERLK